MKSWIKAMAASAGVAALVIGTAAAPAAAAPKDRHNVFVGGVQHLNLTAGQAGAILHRECGESPVTYKRFFDDSQHRDQGYLRCESVPGLYRWVNAGPKG